MNEDVEKYFGEFFVEVSTNTSGDIDNIFISYLEAKEDFFDIDAAVEYMAELMDDERLNDLDITDAIEFLRGCE